MPSPDKRKLPSCQYRNSQPTTRRFVLGQSRVQNLARTSVILKEDFLGFPQTLRTNVGMVLPTGPRLLPSP